MHIALVSSEIAPFAKTGGLGDMVGSLGPALKSMGMDPMFILPRYRNVESREVGVTPYFIDLPAFFDRPGVYGEGGKDYADNAARFTSFCRAALDGLKKLSHPIDILHVHDWQTAMIPVYLKTIYRQDPVFRETRTVLTLHNLGYQGIFPAEGDLPSYLEFYGRMNFLKAGILAADTVTTVSPTYAREALTPEFGCGLEGVLKECPSFQGILNGIDTDQWNPETDPHLPARYSIQDVDGKRDCKKKLQREMGLPERADVPLFGMVSRLVEQKGVDILLEAWKVLGMEDMQWVFLGTGDPRFEKELERMAKADPSRAAVRIEFDTPLSHRITAGCDFILMPSRYEPCGYNQMYAQRYGTIPIVRATGGLKDTVTDVLQPPEAGTGIVFADATAEALHRAVLRALDIYRQEGAWSSLRRRAMDRDFSWQSSGDAYRRLYERALSSPRRDLNGG